MNRWIEHFAEFLDKPPTIPEVDENLGINCSPQSKEEIVKAIKTLKSGKAVGPDDIPAEALKVDVESTANMLLPLFKMILENEDIPKDWKEGHKIKLPKKR